jgi:sterol carrier protein 2
VSRKAFVTGVGMTPFTKPGVGPTYDVLGAEAARKALADAGVAYTEVQQAYVGYVYGDSTCGQKALYRLGMTGLPVFNVNNNCSTGSSALFLARQAIAGGAADCVLALGFEQMKPGALGTNFDDRPSPFTAFDQATDALVGMPELPLAIRYFAGAGASHMKKYGTPLEAFAKVRAKASRHAVNNPLAVLKRELSTEEVLESAALWPGVMTRLMACPPTCGGAAAVLTSGEFAKAQWAGGRVRRRYLDLSARKPL